MWNTIKHDFYQLVNEISNDNELSFSQKRGAIRIVFKKQHRNDLKYYRLITLLNTDVKIISKALAMRLKKVLPSVINPSQTCVPGRNISKNIHTLQDVIKYNNSKNISAAILFIDQEKTANWILRNMNFAKLRNKKKSRFYEIKKLKKSGFCEINIFDNIYIIWILRKI